MYVRWLLLSLLPDRVVFRIEAQDTSANINLANLPELRRLTLAVEINGVHDRCR